MIYFILINEKTKIKIYISKSKNEFLNIKDIPKRKNYLITLDGQIILFLKVYPINIDLLSEEELEAKMDSMTIDFANEQQPYKILVIPRTVDISEHIHEQEKLKNSVQNEISKKIIEMHPVDYVFACDIKTFKYMLKNTQTQELDVEMFLNKKREMMPYTIFGVSPALLIISCIK